MKKTPFELWLETIPGTDKVTIGKITSAWLDSEISETSVFKMGLLEASWNAALDEVVKLIRSGYPAGCFETETHRDIAVEIRKLKVKP